MRRRFLKTSGALLTGSMLGASTIASCAAKTGSVLSADTPLPMTDGMAKEMFFKISLAEWSFNRSLFGKKFTNLDFAAKTKELGIDAIEYVNQFFKDKAENTNYLNQLNDRAADNGVTQVLIMIDGEGGLGDLDSKTRMQAVENHYKWVHAAKYLGCHSIRVNAHGTGSRDDVADAAVQGLGALSEYAAKENINVIVENHGGWSSDGSWLTGVMNKVNLDNCGTLPDFGNFCVKREEGKGYFGKCIEDYDKYQGVAEMMPFAKSVSAKAHAFDAQGNETDIDFMRIMKIVKDHGYTGYVGIEFEGRDTPEKEGILGTKRLLEKVGMALS